MFSFVLYFKEDLQTEALFVSVSKIFQSEIMLQRSIEMVSWSVDIFYRNDTRVVTNL